MILCAKEACGSFVPTLSLEKIQLGVYCFHIEDEVLYVKVGEMLAAFLHLYLQFQVQEVKVMLVTQTLFHVALACGLRPHSESGLK